MLIAVVATNTPDAHLLIKVVANGLTTQIYACGGGHARYFVTV
jgi:hypothetical protein